MSHRRNVQEVPCGNLLNADDIGPPPTPPPQRQYRAPRHQAPVRRPTRAFQDVPCGNLLDFGGADDFYVPPTPPLPSSVQPTGPTTPMRYKPVPGRPGRMQPMFSREYYEDIEQRYPGQPLTWPEMSKMYEYPLGQDNAMGPWLRDPLDATRGPIEPGERATGFENLCGTDPANPYGNQWISDEWNAITAGMGPIDRQEDQRAAVRQMTARAEQQLARHRGHMGRNRP